MRDLGRAFNIVSVNHILENAIGIRNAFVLAQMFQPGFHKKGFDNPSLVSGVLEHSPHISTITPTPSTEPSTSPFTTSIKNA